MPRPKVPPNQRQRAAEACNYCRDSKKKCSGTAPCTHCLRRGLGSECFITYRPRGSRSRSAVLNPSSIVCAPGSASSSTQQQQQQQQQQQGPAPLSPASNVHHATDGGESFRSASPPESRPDRHEIGNPSKRPRLETATRFSSAEPPLTKSRMLLNLRGDRVYIGGAASISFLQLIRRVVSKEIGPSQFSHNAKSDTMLEVESPQAQRGGIDPQLGGATELDMEDKLDYLKTYYSVTEALIDVFEGHEVIGLMTALNENRESEAIGPLKKASIELILAIGAQCKSAFSAHTVGLTYFRSAQQRAFSGFLEDPSIDMVRVFLLMTFYMLGECRRNAAFVYLSIATRAALALGLHSRDSYTDMSDPGNQLRLRVWMSVHIMDKVVNCILGRPTATAGVHSDLKRVLDELPPTARSHNLDCLVASYGIASIINDITDKLYDKKQVTIPVMESLLQEIEFWKRDLPASLRSLSPTTDPANPSTSNGAVGNIHVSCLYYFAVQLVTRPILISTLTAQPISASPHSHLAAACLDAATYLAQTCADACSAGLLHGNMCILKALVFAAGLILGFNIFAKSTVDHEIETAFHGAKDALSFLATQSPQARHYFEILSSLFSAVEKRRASVILGTRSRYVSKIFSLNPAESEQTSHGTELDWTKSILGEEDLSVLMGEDGGQPCSLEQFDGGDLCLDWESLDISQWDSFPFLASPMYSGS